MATTKLQDKIIKSLTTVAAIPLSTLPVKALASFISALIKQKARVLRPAESLKFLMNIENDLYELQGAQSIRYGDGVHTKHRHTNYHNFFIEHIGPADRIIDLGCGYGALAYDIAKHDPSCSVLGIDLNRKNIDKAKTRYSARNLKFICGDILDNSVLPDTTFDTVILSNVLEHLSGRPAFLRAIQTKFSPSRILIRVPLFERDWRVPLKKELGIEWRLDPTHEIEYTLESWREELNQAELQVFHEEIRWGEIWAEVKRVDTAHV